MLLATNHDCKFRVNVRGALRNGCAVEELQEALMQIMPYFGVPAAIQGFRSAIEVMAELEREARAEAGV